MSATVKSRRKAKKLIKQDELASGVGRFLEVIANNKKIFLAALVAIVGLAVFYIGFRFYMMGYKKDFNQALYEASQSLQKEKNYKSIINEYNGLPAHHLARLNLADYYLENQNPKDALAVLKEGLKDNTDANILTTLLALKVIDIHKSKEQFAEAITFIDQENSRVLPTYVNDLELLKGDLLFLSGKKEQARSVYNLLIRQNTKESSDDNETTQEDLIVKQAEARLLEMATGL